MTVDLLRLARGVREDLHVRPSRRPVPMSVQGPARSTPLTSAQGPPAPMVPVLIGTFLLSRRRVLAGLVAERRPWGPRVRRLSGRSDRSTGPGPAFRPSARAPAPGPTPRRLRRAPAPRPRVTWPPPLAVQRKRRAPVSVPAPSTTPTWPAPLS